ncbi:MAG: YraN family protein [Patescibacteria group bacterium]
MKNYRQKLGFIGEKIAEKYLLHKGYRIRQKNFRVREGEIDLIAEFRDELVFVEVKTRTSWLFGPPEQAVDFKKRQKYAAVIEKYLEKNQIEKAAWRFEIISLTFCRPVKKIIIRHLKIL